jgi:hypothetical protein
MDLLLLTMKSLKNISSRTEETKKKKVWNTNINRASVAEV